MGTTTPVIVGTPGSQCVTRCLSTVYTLHISGKHVWSQLNRKFDLLYLCNHETTDGLAALQQQHFYESAVLS